MVNGAMSLTVTQLEDLYRRYAPLVQRRANTILGDADDARDVVHEVFMKAMSASQSIFADPSPMTWLYRVTTNHCIDVLRTRGRRRELLDTRVAHSEEGHEGQGETRALLRRVLARVPDDLQEVAICFYVDEMTQDEIAIHLGCSRRTVGHRLERFRHLAAQIAEEARA